MTVNSRKIVCVVGARPNFVKAAPLLRELSKHRDLCAPLLVHTGQHYDDNLSRRFFADLNLPEPDEYLGIGSGSHAEQTARVMIGIEKTLQREQPDLVVVFGDVNSTLAAAIAASKMGIRLAHVEAGLRNFDRTMPEEVNRLLTDHLADLLFASERSALSNLSREGISEDKVFFTGNIMIDSLVSNLERIRSAPMMERLGLKAGDFATLTLHRPSNVDDPNILAEMLRIMCEIASSLPVVLPCHPRTKKRIAEFGLERMLAHANLKVIEPLGYLDFCGLVFNSRFVLTDSGGIQEETTYLGIPCLTLRETTERPVTVEVGTNVLCGTNSQTILGKVQRILTGNAKKGAIPELWDGHTAERVVAILRERL